MESSKRLIVTADDFGLTVRVNEAIATAHREGIVTTASLMVNAPAFEPAVEIARNNPNLDIGLHLNLTEGRPVSDPATIPSIADASGGFLYRHPLRLARALATGKVRRFDLEREIRAQIEKAVASELWITHIDGHKHVHVMPAVLGIISKVAPEYGIHGIRLTRERVPRLGALLARHKPSRSHILKQYFFGKALSLLSRGSKQDMVAPKRFYGITQTGFLDLATITDVVHDVDDGIHELMCHPGYVDDDLKRTPTRLHAERERELQLLTGAEVRSLIRQAEIGLVSYRDLVGAYGRKSNPVLHRHSAL
jgi:hopanoid biosynthesis associated protein HpnK